MLKKVITAFALMIVSAFCADVSEKNMQIDIRNAPDQPLLTSKTIYQVNSQSLIECQNDPVGIDLGVFALCYRNYRNNFNLEYLRSVFEAMHGLPQKTASFAVLVIDDSATEINDEINDIMFARKQLGQNDFRLYVYWNGDNLGIEHSRDELLALANRLNPKYIVIADSDDLFHKDCLKIMYLAMLNNPDLYLLLLECTDFGFLRNRLEDICQYQEQDLDIENFTLTLKTDKLENGSASDWISFDSVPLVRHNNIPRSNGYLPIMVRLFDGIPTKCDEEDGNMYYWYLQLTIKLSELDSQARYAFLSSVDDAFLYFYRLYEGSNSHNITRETTLSYFRDFYDICNKVAHTEGHEKTIVGVLIKEWAPLSTIIDAGIDSQDRLVESADLNETIHSFYKMVHGLSNGRIEEATDWVKQFCDNKLNALAPLIEKEIKARSDDEETQTEIDAQPNEGNND